MTIVANRTTEEQIRMQRVANHMKAVVARYRIESAAKLAAVAGVGSGVIVAISLFFNTGSLRSLTIVLLVFAAVFAASRIGFVTGRFCMSAANIMEAAMFGMCTVCEAEQEHRRHLCSDVNCHRHPAGEDDQL
jgi:hypothetical protein